MRTVTTWPLFVVALLGATATHAQQDPPFKCGADDLSLSAPPGGHTPEELAAMRAADAGLEEFTRRFVAAHVLGGREPYVIPVVFHIIHNNGPENISDAQVHDALRILNEDFNKLNADWPNVRPEFLPIVADVGVEFRLARKDPNGNCTRGIIRVRSQLTTAGNQLMKDLSYWPRNRYLNVWVAASAGDGASGYAYRPPNAPFSGDGIVMRHDYFGSTGTSTPSRSRILTHEVGHWLNLFHIWGDSNTAGSAGNCSMDDQVTDTPNTVGSSACNLSARTCDGTLDNVENYMDYSFCHRMFTEGQAARMIAALNAVTAQRNQLWQPSNLALAGVDGTSLLCAVELTSDLRTICAGGSVAFTDRSYHDVTSRTWDFPGGTPATSTDPNPVVTYTQPGTHPVTLTVSNGTTTLDTTIAAYVTVLDNPGAATPLIEGFEDHPDLGASHWTVVNPHNNNTFTITDAAAYSGSRSVRVPNNLAMGGQIDEIVSGPIDMSGATQARITFRYAYAPRSTMSDDRLRVHVSNDCGATWSMRLQLRGTSTLNTAGGMETGDFIPTASQWAPAEITGISSAHHVSDFRVRFEFESYGGNNLYIDDINIEGSPVGIGERVPGNGGTLTVVPNPVEGGSARAVFGMARAGQARIELLDVLGRQLAVLHDGQLPAGPQSVELPVGALQGGLYFMRLRQGARNEAVRFVVR